MTISLVVKGVATTLSFDDVALEDDDFNTMTDEEIKLRVARHYDQPEDHYDGYVVDRYPGDGTGTNFVIRKKAVYGGSDEDDLADKFEEIFGDTDNARAPDGVSILTMMLVELVKRVSELTDRLNEMEVRLAWLEGAAGKK